MLVNNRRQKMNDSDGSDIPLPSTSEIHCHLKYRCVAQPQVYMSQQVGQAQQT